MANMIKVKKIFDDDCWIILSSFLIETSEFVIGRCFNRGEDDDGDDGVFVNKDGTICGEKKFDDDNIGDWSEKWLLLLLLFGEVKIFDGVEFNCSIHKLFRIVDAAKRKRDHNWTCCWPNNVVVEDDWTNKGDVWDIENGFEPNVLFGVDEIIGRI